MSDGADGEEFYLNQQIDEPINDFIVVHIYNMSETYHLTKQILLDARLIQKSDCFFYQILTREMEEFNSLYSFSCLIARSNIEADLYLNVDKEAFGHIVEYIQTNQIDVAAIYTNSKLFYKVMDLASMFVMPTLVSILKNFFYEQHKKILLETLGNTISNKFE